MHFLLLSQRTADERTTWQRITDLDGHHFAGLFPTGCKVVYTNHTSCVWRSLVLDLAWPFTHCRARGVTLKLTKLVDGACGGDLQEFALEIRGDYYL